MYCQQNTMGGSKALVSTEASPITFLERQNAIKIQKKLDRRIGYDRCTFCCFRCCFARADNDGDDNDAGQRFQLQR
jgi:hypothetical protein